MNEMRKLGAGSRPLASTEVAEVVDTKPESGPSLADRITKVVPSASADLARAPVKNGDAVRSQPAIAVQENDKTSDIADAPSARDNGPKTEPNEPPEKQESDNGDENRPESRPGLMERIAGLGKT